MNLSTITLPTSLIDQALLADPHLKSTSSRRQYSANLRKFEEWAEQLEGFDNAYNFHRLQEVIKTNFWDLWEEQFSCSFPTGEGYVSFFKSVECSEYYLAKVHTRNFKVSPGSDAFVIQWHEGPAIYEEYLVIGTREDFLDVYVDKGSVTYPKFISVAMFT